MAEYFLKSDVIELFDRVLENLERQQKNEELDATAHLINEVAITSISTLEKSIKLMRFTTFPD